MKRIIALFMSLLFCVLTFVACAEEAATHSDSEEDSEKSTASGDETSTDETSVDETSAEDSSVSSWYPDDFSIPEESSNPPESSAPDTSSGFELPILKPFDNLDEFTYYTIYTSKKRKDGIYPYDFFVSSVDELPDLDYVDPIEGIKEEDIYNLDEAVGDIPSYRTHIQKYDEEFFKEKELTVLVVECEKATPPALESVYHRQDERLLFVVEREYDVEEEQVYHIFIETDKGVVSSFGIWGVDYTHHLDMYEIQQ